jgi:hypothetical protein
MEDGIADTDLFNLKAIKVRYIYWLANLFERGNIFTVCHNKLISHFLLLTFFLCSCSSYTFSIENLGRIFSKSLQNLRD